MFVFPVDMNYYSLLLAVLKPHLWPGRLWLKKTKGHNSPQLLFSIPLPPGGFGIVRKLERKALQRKTATFVGAWVELMVRRRKA